MIIKDITINNYGPFSTPVKIHFHPQVTVLTGPNDTGKSSILRLIDLIWKNGLITEDDANLDRIYSSSNSWKDDPEISCQVSFIGTKLVSKYLNAKTAGPDTEIETEFRLAPDAKLRRVIKIGGSGSYTNINSDIFIGSPRVLFFTSSIEQIRTVIDLGNPNPTEEKFLQLAFGHNPLEKLSDMSDWNVTRTLRAGENQINLALDKVMPEGMNYQVLLHQMEGANTFRLSVSMRDSHYGDAPIHLRGAGVRKMLSLMVRLSDRELDEEFTYILIDEPENSLHADSQHLLRRFLEGLGKNENIQVVYATHASSMINPLHSDRIRLFYRENRDGKATSMVNNKPYDDNFFAVRTSLGLSPADSLLYAPVTIIVEGSTELISLPKILERLTKESFGGFENIEEILPLIYILNGQGDSFDKWCHLIKSQGATPIIFVDGDKVRRVNQLRESGKLGDVSVISLNEGKEFEELVSRSSYFEALQTDLEKAEITLEDFEEWEESAGLHPKMMFTKRVERWLQDTKDPEIIYDKPKIMLMVINRINLDDINLQPIKALVEEVEQTLARII
jgi:energy-coupling factor transporter ATP-binding protein EcfA2